MLDYHTWHMVWSDQRRVEKLAVRVFTRRPPLDSLCSWGKIRCPEAATANYQPNSTKIDSKDTKKGAEKFLVAVEAQVNSVEMFYS